MFRGNDSEFCILASRLSRGGGTARSRSIPTSFPFPSPRLSIRSDQTVWHCASSGPHAEMLLAVTRLHSENHRTSLIPYWLVLQRKRVERVEFGGWLLILYAQWATRAEMIFMTI